MFHKIKLIVLTLGIVILIASSAKVGVTWQVNVPMNEL